MCDEPPQKRPIRVLDVRNYSLVEGDAIKAPYAILSHRWGSQDQEVSYKEWEDRNHGQLRERQGYAKIRGACEQAERDGLVYLWVDTICINKADTAELSESINSMYAWYQNAAVKVVFFAWDWSSLGDLANLLEPVYAATGISHDILRHDIAVHDCTIAQRLSWASRRTTQKVEDMTYSLLGVLDVNMSLRYGEGKRAFFRLQRKLLTKTNDLTVLAWDSQDRSLRSRLFATSPANFANSGCIRMAEHVTNDAEYSLNNVGLTGLFPVVEQHNSKGYNDLVPLYCYRSDSPDDMLALRLTTTSTSRNSGKITYSIDVDQHDDQVAAQSSRLDTIHSFPTFSMRRVQLTIKHEPQQALAWNTKHEIAVRAQLTDRVESKDSGNLATTSMTPVPQSSGVQSYSIISEAVHGIWSVDSDSDCSTWSDTFAELVTAVDPTTEEQRSPRRNSLEFSIPPVGRPMALLREGSSAAGSAEHDGRAGYTETPTRGDQATNVAFEPPGSHPGFYQQSRASARTNGADQAVLISETQSRSMYQMSSRALNSACNASASLSGQSPRVQSTSKDSTVLLNTKAHDLEHATADSGSHAGNVKTYNTGYSNEDNDRNIFSHFKVQRQPEKFFVLGRVFLLLWNEKPGGTSTVISAQMAMPMQLHADSDAHGARMWSKVRRFIVVRVANDGGSCTALPVLTYGGRGVSKTGVIKADHGIVYTTPEAPEPRQDERPQRGETCMLSQPIRVVLHDTINKLDPMSRINFGDPCTVSYDTEVQPLGMVHSMSMVALTYQFRHVCEQRGSIGSR
ncbi:hypothetical protein LTR15_008050 [Elasticomyces elasticus]|nr:hypothetical protein LTR15_008050 [Elasticomyces elasticus]